MSRNLLITLYLLSIMSLQTLSDIMNNTISEEYKPNRPEKGGYFRVASPCAARLLSGGAFCHPSHQSRGGRPHRATTRVFSKFPLEASLQIP